MNLRITHPDLPFVAKIQLDFYFTQALVGHSSLRIFKDISRYRCLVWKKKGGNFGRSILLDKKRIVFDVVWMCFELFGDVMVICKIS